MRRRQTWLLVLAGLLLLAALDSLRPPPDQLTGRAYVGLVRLYQSAGRPLLEGRVRCRHCPSCSDYSAEAVQVHGIRRGLLLTGRRLTSCTSDAPPDTFDPVPPPDCPE